MVTLVLTIGLLNVAVGFALAILLEQPVAIPWPALPRIHWRRAPRPTHGRAQRPSEPQPAVQDSVVAPAPVSESSPPVSDSPLPAVSEILNRQSLPAEWIEILESQRLAPRSFAEAVLWVVRCRLPAHREQLTTLTRPYRSDAKLSLPSQELHDAVKAWENQLTAWETTLREYNESSAYEELRIELRKLLVEQVAHLESAWPAIEQLNGGGDGQVDDSAIVRAICQLLATTNVLRDRVDEMLSVLLWQEQRLAEATENLQIDKASQILNRLGLTVLVHDWLTKDPDRVRLVCGVLVDVDHFTALNEKLGSGVGDNTLIAVARLLKDLVRKERGYDRVARLDGQKFFLFFGDTALRNATNGAERIRQSMQATSFKNGEIGFPVTMSCAVSEWPKSDSFDEWLFGMQHLLASAKQAGRNCTCVAEANGPRVLTPAQHALQPREVVVGDSC